MAEAWWWLRCDAPVWEEVEVLCAPLGPTFTGIVVEKDEPEVDELWWWWWWCCDAPWWEDEVVPLGPTFTGTVVEKDEPDVTVGDAL